MTASAVFFLEISMENWGSWLKTRAAVTWSVGRGPLWIAGKAREIIVRRRLKHFLLPAPLQADRMGMQGVIRQYQLPPLPFGQSVLRQRQIQIFIPAVKLVADHRMAHCGQMNADLMFPSRFWTHPQKGKLPLRAAKAPFHPELRQGAGAIAANAMFHGDLAAFVLAQRQIDASRILPHRAVDNGQIYLFDGAAFPKFAQLPGGQRAFGSKNHAARFAVEPVDQVRRPLRAQIKAGPADQARPLVALGWMTDQAGGLIDDQQVGILENDLEERGKAEGRSQKWRPASTVGCTSCFLINSYFPICFSG